MRIGPQIGPRVGSVVGPSIGMATPGPVAFIGASDVLFDEPGDAVTIEAVNPAGVRAGDTLLMIIATDQAAGVPPAAGLPPGWAILSVVETGNSALVTILRRIVGSEPPSHLITLGDGAGPAYPVGSVLIAYRGLNASASLIGISADDVASNAFPCPSQTLTTATDLYLGIVWLSDGALAVTPPGGTTERFDASQRSDAATDRQLEVFEFLKGSTGATGTKTATIAAPHNGIAASILLRASV